MDHSNLYAHPKMPTLCVRKGVLQQADTKVKKQLWTFSSNSAPHDGDDDDDAPAAAVHRSLNSKTREPVHSFELHIFEHGVHEDDEEQEEYDQLQVILADPVLNSTPTPKHFQYYTFHHVHEDDEEQQHDLLAEQKYKNEKHNILQVEEDEQLHLDADLSNKWKYLWMDDGPPHKIIARQQLALRREKLAYSMVEGHGRTLKGRDLFNFRDSLLKD